MITQAVVRPWRSTRRAVESLIKAGAFDQLEDTRRGMLESVEGILKSVETDARKNVAGQLDLFSQLDDEDEWDDYHIPKVPEYPPRNCCAWRRM